LVGNGPIPREATADALHIAIAAVNGIDYLLTWDCRHLANASLRVQIAALRENAEQRGGRTKRLVETALVRDRA